MKNTMLMLVAAACLLILAACGGGAYDFTLKREADATADDLAKCGVGAYWVAPAASAPAGDRGKCYEYTVLPAPGAASTPASAPG